MRFMFIRAATNATRQTFLSSAALDFRDHFSHVAGVVAAQCLYSGLGTPDPDREPVRGAVAASRLRNDQQE